MDLVEDDGLVHVVEHETRGDDVLEEQIFCRNLPVWKPHQGYPIVSLFR